MYSHQPTHSSFTSLLVSYKQLDSIKMVSLYTLITFIPLLASAARIPHNLLDLDAAAAVVADAKADIGLNLIPRTNGPRPPTLPIPVTPPPIVPEVVGAVTGLLPQIDAGLSFCVTLAADAHLVADGQVLFIAAGVCLCADADVEVNPSPNGVTVVASSGLTVRGATAVKLRASVRDNPSHVDISLLTLDRSSGPYMACLPMDPTTSTFK
jgi:hypothetical protein